MAILNPTIRERIIREIVTSLGETAGELRGLQDWNPVVRGRVDYEPEELPFITVNPQQDTATRSQMGRQSLEMAVNVVALFPTALPVVAADATPSELGEAILGAIILAVMAGTTELNALVDDIAYVTGGIADYPGETEQVTVVETSFTVKYRTALGDPYNQ